MATIDAGGPAEVTTVGAGPGPRRPARTLAPATRRGVGANNDASGDELPPSLRTGNKAAAVESTATGAGSSAEGGLSSLASLLSVSSLSTAGVVMGE